MIIDIRMTNGMKIQKRKLNLLEIEKSGRFSLSCLSSERYEFHGKINAA